MLREVISAMSTGRVGRGWSGHINNNNNNNNFSISIFLVKFFSGTSRNRQKRDVQRGINAGNRPH